MKKIIYSTLLFTLFSFSAFSQNKKGDFNLSAGIGFGSLTETSVAIGDAISRIIFGNSNDDLTKSKFGAINIGAKYSLSNKVRIGADFVYEKFEGGNINIGVISVIPRADLIWVNKNNFRFYSGIGVGVAFTDDNDGGSSFAFNAVPAGVEFGKDICFYAELAAGFNGTISGGVRFKL
jgi:hypothetical protein